MSSSNGCLPVCSLGEAQQQPERVSVGGDRLRAGVALGDQTLGEIRLKRGRERGHESTSGSRSRRRLTRSSSSGTASKYQYELAGSTCPRNADSSGIRRSMSSPASMPVQQRVHSKGMPEIVRAGSGTSAAAVQADLADQLR